MQVHRSFCPRNVYTWMSDDRLPKFSISKTQAWICVSKPALSVASTISGNGLGPKILQSFLILLSPSTSGPLGFPASATFKLFPEPYHVSSLHCYPLVQPLITSASLKDPPNWFLRFHSYSPIISFQHSSQKEPLKLELDHWFFDSKPSDEKPEPLQWAHMTCNGLCYFHDLISDC